MLFFFKWFLLNSAKTTLTVEDALADKNTLLNASSYLATSSVIGSDGTTLCPPRSSASSATCSAAPLVLTPLSSVSSSDPHLPTGYAAVGASGSPYEVDIFAPGAGQPQTDSHGRYVIVCRWEQAESSTTSESFAVLISGADGAVQSNCGGQAANTDDVALFSNVADALNRANTWANHTNGTTTYGATGSQATFDAGGNLATPGTITAGAGSFTSLTDSGALTVSGVATMNGGEAVTGGLSTDTLTTSGNVTIHGTSISAPTAALTVNQLVVMSTTLSSFFFGPVSITGALTAHAASFTSITDSGALTVSGAATMNGGEAVTGGLSTDTLTTSGNTSVGGNLTVTGTLTGSAATFSGTVTAAGFANTGNQSVTGTTTLTGALSAGSASFTSITDSGPLSVAGASNLSGGAAVTGGLSTDSLTTSGNANVAGTLSAANVGIGTSSPSAPLEVQSSGDTVLKLSSSATNANTYVYFAGKGSGGTYTGKIQGGWYGSFTFIPGLDLTNSFVFNNAANSSSILDIDTTNGRVGIGTTSPAYMLDAESTGNATLKVGSGGSNNASLLLAGSNAGTQHTAIIQSGFYGNITFTPGVDGQKAFAFNNAAGSATVIDVDTSTSRVGIGTSSPQATLDVNGYARLKAETAAPAACSTTNDGAIALTAYNYTLCVCRGAAAAWVSTNDGVTTCQW